MISFKDFLQWYNNKDVVPTLEAMQKVIDIYHDKRIDMLKMGSAYTNPQITYSTQFIWEN